MSTAAGAGAEALPPSVTFLLLLLACKMVPSSKTKLVDRLLALVFSPLSASSIDADVFLSLNPSTVLSLPPCSLLVPTSASKSLLCLEGARCDTCPLRAEVRPSRADLRPSQRAELL